MKKESISLSSLKPNPNNPRVIRDERFRILVRSVAQFPKMMAIRGIVVDSQMMCLGGNQRLKALQEIVKMPESDLLELLTDQYAENMQVWEPIRASKKIPASWVIDGSAMTEDEVRRFIIADNVELGEHDWKALSKEWDVDLLSGWGVNILSLIEEESDLIEDSFDLPDEEDILTDIMPGDVFEIGPHRLMCGDSANIEDVKKLMVNKKADMVFTDPPYGVAIGKKNKFLNSFQKAGRNLKDIKDDDASPDELKKILLPAFKNIRSVMSDDCTVFVTAPQGGDLGMMMMMMMKESGLPVRHILIWEKDSPTFSMGRLDYEYQHEPILLTWGKRHKFYGQGQHKTSVWKIPKPRSSKEHPTMKPVALVENALLNNSQKGDLIIDFYAGSGTVMVASHQTKRRAFCMEIEPKYCQVIIDRMLKIEPDLIVKKIS